MSQTPIIPLPKLREQVQALANEFDGAIMFHEALRVAMDDPKLHERLGVSYATNTFRVIVTALRRELVLALTRMWDKRSDTLRADMIVRAACSPSMIAEMATERGAKMSASSMKGGTHQIAASTWTTAVHNALAEKAQEARALAAQYFPDGAKHHLLEKMRTLRHERLAHFSVQATAAPEKNATDQEIEEFYADNARLVSLLLSLVLAMAFDPEDAAGVQRHYAALFWASVEGERTESHALFRRTPP